MVSEVWVLLTSAPHSLVEIDIVIMDVMVGLEGIRA